MAVSICNQLQSKFLPACLLSAGGKPSSGSITKQVAEKFNVKQILQFDTEAVVEKNLS